MFYTGLDLSAVLAVGTGASGLDFLAPFLRGDFLTNTMIIPDDRLGKCFEDFSEDFF